METTNVVIIDDQNLMAGSFRKYFKYRFGKDVNVCSSSDPVSCINEIGDAGQVIVLDYPSDGHYDTQHATNIVNTIKERRPDTDIIVLSSEKDVRGDMVRTTEQLELKASKYILDVTAIPVTTWGAIKNKFWLPVKLLVDEFSVSNYIELFLTLSFMIAAVVMIALFSINLFK